MKTLNILIFFSIVTCSVLSYSMNQETRVLPPVNFFPNYPLYGRESVSMQEKEVNRYVLWCKRLHQTELQQRIAFADSIIERELEVLPAIDGSTPKPHLTKVALWKQRQKEAEREIFSIHRNKTAQQLKQLEDIRELTHDLCNIVFQSNAGTVNFFGSFKRIVTEEEESLRMALADKCKQVIGSL